MFARYLVLITFVLCVLLGLSSGNPLYMQKQQFDDLPQYKVAKRSNAELINGLIGMDLGTLTAVGKRSNAELINGLLAMHLGKLSSAGRR